MKFDKYRPLFVSPFGWFLFRLLFPSLYDYIVCLDDENVRLLLRMGELMRMLRE